MKLSESYEVRVPFMSIDPRSRVREIQVVKDWVMLTAVYPNYGDLSPEEIIGKVKDAIDAYGKPLSRTDEIVVVDDGITIREQQSEKGESNG